MPKIDNPFKMSIKKALIYTQGSGRDRNFPFSQRSTQFLCGFVHYICLQKAM